MKKEEDALAIMKYGSTGVGINYNEKGSEYKIYKYKNSRPPGRP